MDRTLSEIAGWMRDARRVAALTGAGISTDSGIPDFRGPQGVWTKNPGAERLSTLQAYMSDPEVRVAAWKARLEHPTWSARPNPGHRARNDPLLDTTHLQLFDPKGGKSLTVA
jgi:NAD-dependent deacetylase